MNDARFLQAASTATREAGRTVQFVEAARLAGLVAARFKLDNGLSILLAPDSHAPVFAYQTWFKVGSKDEDPNRTGLAHLFEHLMFKGTKKHAPGEFDREMERRGSQTNAATWVDWTYYHVALASRGDNLATVVEFEVDRMTGLLLDDKTFRSELEVVKNERRMSVDDSVPGTLHEHLYATAFEAHPYRWPTIGSMAHLEASTLDDLRHFYRTYYAPNNAVVVVAGDLDVEATLTLLAKSYGVLEAQPVPPRRKVQEPVQRAPRHKRIELPMVATQLVIAYHAPAQLDALYPATEMLGEALTVGDNARLYNRLVTTEKLCTDIEGALSPFAEPGLYEVFATLRPGADPKRVIDIVQEELTRLSRGLASDELDKAKNGLELGFWESFRTADGMSEALGHNQVNYDDMKLAFTTRERIAAVGAEELRRAAEIFTEHNRTVVLAEPPAV